MSRLLEALAGLADELDKTETPEVADEIDELIKEVAKLEAEEDKAEKTLCSECGGSGAGKDEPWCDKCKGSGTVAVKEASLLKTAYIKKRDGKWCVLSHKHKSLGCYKTRREALKRLRQVEFFKYNK